MTAGPSPVERAPTDRLAAVGLSAEDARAIYRLMLVTRAIDERAWILGYQGKAQFVLTCTGHEAAQLGSAWPLRPGWDYVAGYYRSLAVGLRLGITPEQTFRNFLGRVGDPHGGARQLATHFGIPQLGLLSTSSSVATQIPHAVGAALAARYRGEDRVAVAYFGEGATSKGDFHEAANFAGIHRLPVIFFCENNGYAISAPRAVQMAVADVASRAEGYGFPGVVVDGNDLLAVYEVSREAIARARRGEGPTLIEAKTYRLTPHSNADDDRVYRDPAEVARWRQPDRDPVLRFRGVLLKLGLLSEEEDERWRAEVRAEVQAAADRAEAAPLPEGPTALRNVYADRMETAPWQ